MLTASEQDVSETIREVVIDAADESPLPTATADLLVARQSSDTGPGLSRLSCEGTAGLHEIAPEWSGTKKERQFLAVAVIALVAFGSGMAQSQGGAVGEPSAGQLEEVTVTARKRDESIQATPLAVQAFSANQLVERGITGLSDLSKFTPGLTFFTGVSRFNSAFSIRGITQVNPFGDNRRDLVTVFVDGVPLVGGPSAIGSEDLQRVEVIKGPQSALFGRATFGGAISMITTTPGDEFKGRVSATAATYGDYRGTAALEAPIVDGILAAGVFVEASTFDGFYKNDLGGRLGASDRRYYSTTLSFTPTESISVKLRYSDRHDVDGEAASSMIARWFDHNCGPFPGFATRPLTGLPPGFTVARSRQTYCGELKAPNSVGINTTLPAASLGKALFDKNQLVLDHSLLSGTADWSLLGGHTFTFTGSRQKQQIRVVGDVDRTPEDRYQYQNNTIQPQDTYELRLNSPAGQRFTYMLGASRLESEFRVASAFINGTLFGATSGGPTTTPTPNVSNAVTNSVFGSVGFDITERLNVSAEARRQKDTIGSGLGLPTAFEVETTATLPRFLMLYQLNDESNLYANYAKGNQPTQGYATYFQLTPARQEVARANGVSATAPEAIVNNYEIGLKHRENDGSWYVNTSLYYFNWVDRQALATLQIDLNGDGIIDVRPAPQGEVFNAVPVPAGDSNTRGIEIDGAYRVTDAVTVGGNIAYADTRITKSLNEPLLQRLFGLADGAGKQFPLVPEISGAAFVQYEANPADNLGWFARSDVTYIGKRWDSIANLAYVMPQVRVNVRAGLRMRAWELTGWINNLFDDRTLESSRGQGDSAADPSFFQLTASEAALPNKRQFGVGATYRF